MDPGNGKYLPSMEVFKERQLCLHYITENTPSRKELHLQLVRGKMVELFILEEKKQRQTLIFHLTPKKKN